MKLKNFTRLFAVFSVVSIFLTACYNYNDTAYLDELDVTLTYFDKTFDFQTYQTFTIRDSVGLISNYLTDAQIADFYKPGAGSDLIRNLVKQKFIDEGYTFAEDPNTADFAVNLVAAAVNTEVYGYYPGWWWGYEGYYDYYYYYWYPWYGYPWYYVEYNYQTGTLLIEMADGESVRAYRTWAADKTQEEINNADPSTIPEVKYRWQALINGVNGGTTSYNQQRLERGVDEAFAQSSYLKKN